MTGQGVDQEWRVVGIGTLWTVDHHQRASPGLQEDEGLGRHFGTLWTLVAHHRARPGGYLFDQLGTIDFSEGIFRLLDENLYSA